MIRVTANVSYGVGLWVAAMCAAVYAMAAEPPEWSAGTPDDVGIITHTWTTPYQRGETQVRVLLPKKLPADRKLPVVYVLPVEAGREQKYGDGLTEVCRHELADRYQAIFVAPTFSALPWYADHPTNKELRQESHLLQAVLPAVEKAYPAERNARGRLLLGFSKSGWGAWSLLLRHPDQFGQAAAFDAPLMKDLPNQFGMEAIFGTQENFVQYQITRLLAVQAPHLKAAKTSRLILLDRGNFQDQHERIIERCREWEIPLRHLPSEPRKHDWHSGWVPEAVAAFFAKP